MGNMDEVKTLWDSRHPLFGVLRDDIFGRNLMFMSGIFTGYG
jgi:hypothetical protein